MDVYPRSNDSSDHEFLLVKLKYTICLIQYKSSSVLNDRSSHRRCSVRKGVLRNFTKFTGKYLCQSLFFNKVASKMRRLQDNISHEK